MTPPKCFSGTKVRRTFGMNKEKGRNFRFCLEIIMQSICHDICPIVYHFHTGISDFHVVPI